MEGDPMNDDRVWVLLVILGSLIGFAILAYHLGIERGRELERRDRPIFGWSDEFEQWFLEQTDG